MAAHPQRPTLSIQLDTVSHDGERARQRRRVGSLSTPSPERERDEQRDGGDAEHPQPEPWRFDALAQRRPRMDGVSMRSAPAFSTQRAT